LPEGLQHLSVIFHFKEMHLMLPEKIKSRLVERATSFFDRTEQHATAKFLVGMTPDGTYVYLSKAFGGNASDKFVLENSGFLKHLRSGMEVMAFRRDTEEVLAKRGVHVNIPRMLVEDGEPVLDAAAKTVRKAYCRMNKFLVLKHLFPTNREQQLQMVLKCCLGLANINNLVRLKRLENLNM